MALPDWMKRELREKEIKVAVIEKLLLKTRLLLLAYC